MTRKPRLRTRQQEKDEQEDKRIGWRGDYVTIGTVVPGRMDEIYGELNQVKVKGLVGKGRTAFYVIEWKTHIRHESVEATGKMFTRIGKCQVYNPYSLDWNDHVRVGITYICANSNE
jgi:hypothetical protein